MTKKSKTKNNKLILVVIAILSLCLLAGIVMLGKVTTEKHVVENKLELFERCRQLGGSFAKDDTEQKTCISYSNVESIDSSIKSYADCEEDYFERNGIRLGVPAVGSDDVDKEELIKCEVPDGRVFYTTKSGYFTWK